MSEKDDNLTSTAMLELAKLIKEIRDSSDAGLKAQMAAQADLLIRTMPENKFPPLISVFNPQGDRDHPRPELKCKMFHNGYQLEREQLTKEELDLLNQLEPGNYFVTKANGQRIAFDVTAERDNAGQLQKLMIDFKSKGDDRHDHRSIEAYLREAMGKGIPSTAQLEKQVAKLKAELAEARGAGAAA